VVSCALSILVIIDSISYRVVVPNLVQLPRLNSLNVSVRG
jgi:hypothetical protein